MAIVHYMSVYNQKTDQLARLSSKYIYTTLRLFIKKFGRINVPEDGKPRKDSRATICQYRCIIISRLASFPALQQYRTYIDNFKLFRRKSYVRDLKNHFKNNYKMSQESWATQCLEEERKCLGVISRMASCPAPEQNMSGCNQQNRQLSSPRREHVWV